MPESSMNIFDSKTFKVDDYVKDLVQECVGGSELQQRRAKIQTFSDQTSSQLKKHVYENYMQFIETAKEISHLESEMYQLSHILIEQRNLLATLREDSIGDNQKQIVEDEEKGASLDQSALDEMHNKKTINLIKESLKGYSGSLENKTLIREGGLIELDSTDYRPICRTHLFLFNDALILAKVKHDKSLEFVAEYETKKLAVINIKDLDGVRNAINIITTDGSRIFQCINLSAKTEWIERFEVAVKFNQTRSKKAQAPQPPKVEKQISSTEDQATSPTADLSPIAENVGPEWFVSAPEEIQTLIAQRHFEDALALIQKCTEFLASDKSSLANAVEVADKLNQLKTALADVLLQELSNCHSRSLNAALRSSRRPLKLLAEMNKAREACGMLLRVCTTAIRTAQRQARRNNLEVSEIFFCDVAQVASEFVAAFSSQPACTSTLIVWCNTELQHFASQLIKHYLPKGTLLEDVAKCVEGVRQPCAKLTEIGLDLTYHIEGLLRTALEQIIEDSRFRLLESVGRSEEIWQPYNLQTKSNLRSLLREMDGAGIDLRPQVTGDTWINLTQTTVNFCRHFMAMTDSCAILAKNETLKQDAEMLLKDLFVAQQAIKPSKAMNIDMNFVAKNKNYLIEALLPVAIEKFGNTCGRPSELLKEMAVQLKGVPRPKPRSIYQTDVL